MAWRLRFDFAGGRHTLRVAGEAAFASFQEFLRLAVVQALGNAHAAIEFGDDRFTTQSVEDNADLLLSRILLAGRPADIADKPL